ncbi:hypothetical protein Tco_1074541, partial [Tanacetum coccineum]
SGTAERVFLQESIHLTLIRIDYIVSPFPNTPNRAAKDIMKKFISSRGALRSDGVRSQIPNGKHGKDHREIEVIKYHSEVLVTTCYQKPETGSRREARDNRLELAVFNACDSADVLLKLLLFSAVLLLLNVP